MCVGVHEIDLTYLPHCVQEEIKFDICEEMFYKSPIFRGLDETFLMGLAKTAKVCINFIVWLRNWLQSNLSRNILSST